MACSATWRTHSVEVLFEYAREKYKYTGINTSMAAVAAQKQAALDEPEVPPAGKDEDRERFLAVYADIVKCLKEELESRYEAPAAAVDWVSRMMDYTVPGGKLNRGLTVLHTARLLSPEKGITKGLAYEASVLGWCVEWLQAFFLVADDKMDSSVTRRGKPCWYRVPGVGNTAINDAFVLEAQIYCILRRFFRTKTYYPVLLELFHETTMQTEVGQLLDLTTQPIEGPINLDLFTLKRYDSIVKYKTAFYSFYLPLALGLVVSGVTDDATLDAVRAICLQMGKYFQVQDDFLDCYGAPEVIGKIGTDIQDKKCSWLVVQAMDRANPEQLTTIKTNYGINDPAKIAIIKQIYKDLDLETVFREYEEASYKEISGLIDTFDESTGVPRECFRKLLAKIYKRNV